MKSKRILICTAAGLLAFTTHLHAGTIDDINPPAGTIGTVVRLTVTGLNANKTYVLVENGAKARKSKLKVVGSGTDASGEFVDVKIKKAQAGSYQVGVKRRGGVNSVSSATLEILGPDINSVNPGGALPGDAVDLLVEYAGSGRIKAFVGSNKARIDVVEPLGTTGLNGGPLTRVAIQVPDLPDGIWPVTFKNKVGHDILKAALNIQGSGTLIDKPVAFVRIEGKSTFKAKNRKVSVDNKPGATEIGAVMGQKKGLIVSLPVEEHELNAGDFFSAGPANILYTKKSRRGDTVWAAEPAGAGAMWQIDVIALTENRIAVYICGRLTRLVGPGADFLDISGFVVAPRFEPGSGPTPCPVHWHADMSVLGAYDSDPEMTGAVYFDVGSPLGRTRIGASRTETSGINSGFNIDMVFDPTTQSAAVINGIASLFGFAFTPDDGISWASMPNPDGSTTMTVEVTQVLDPIDPLDPYSGYIVGTFSGTMQSLGTGEVQTVAGTFCVPYELFSDAGGS